MDRLKIIFILITVLWWGGCAPEEDPPPPPPPPDECELVCPGGTHLDADACECVPDEEPPPPPPPATPPSAYIQWTCDASKPTCISRAEWGESLDRAYHAWRGHVDLLYLADHGQPYLKGGEKELVKDTTLAQLDAIVLEQFATDERGNRTIHRINTLKHRFFEEDPLAPWHRSQVRKDVATAMRNELHDATREHGEISEQLGDFPGCDSIRCKVKALNSEE